jgi:type VI protein secretion system component VasF
MNRRQARKPLLIWPDGEPLYPEQLPSRGEVLVWLFFIGCCVAALWLLLGMAA